MSESPYDEVIPWTPASPEEVEEDRRRRSAELAKQKAAEGLMLATIEAAKIVYELLTESEDEQVQLRAAEMIFSRTIPKIAAKHAPQDAEAIESVDVTSLRESIVEIVDNAKRRGT